MCVCNIGKMKGYILRTFKQLLFFTYISSGERNILKRVFSIDLFHFFFVYIDRRNSLSFILLLIPFFHILSCIFSWVWGLASFFFMFCVLCVKMQEGCIRAKQKRRCEKFETFPTLQFLHTSSALLGLRNEYEKKKKKSLIGL